MKDFDEWNKVKKETNTADRTIMIKEGEIAWCKVGLNIGDETYGKGEFFSRPVLIIKKFSKNTFWGLPISKQFKKGSWYFYLKHIDRTVILNQMRLFDRKRLSEKIFVISEAQLEDIKNKIILLLKS